MSGKNELLNKVVTSYTDYTDQQNSTIPGQIVGGSQIVSTIVTDTIKVLSNVNARDFSRTLTSIEKVLKKFGGDPSAFNRLRDVTYWINKNKIAEVGLAKLEKYGGYADIVDKINTIAPNAIKVVTSIITMTQIIENDKLSNKEKTKAFNIAFASLKDGSAELSFLVIDMTFGRIPILGPIVSSMAEGPFKKFVKSDTFQNGVNWWEAQNEKLVDKIAEKTGLKDLIKEKAKEYRKEHTPKNIVLAQDNTISNIPEILKPRNFTPSTIIDLTEVSRTSVTSSRECIKQNPILSR